MELKYGIVYGIVGRNGCGKTTLMNALFKKYHDKSIIYIKQNDYLIEQYTIEENLKLNYYDFNDHLLNKYVDYQTIRKLYPSQVSLGQRQIVSIICALYSHSELIIFDETWSGLNEDVLNDLMILCKEMIQDKIVFMISHQQSVVNYCDEIIDFKEGIPHISLNVLKEKQESKISIKSILKYQERHWFKFIFLYTILASCFLFVTVAVYYKQRNYEAIQNNINREHTPEVFIMNNTDIYHPYYRSYMPEYSSISNQSLKQIKNIKGLSQIEPYVSFQLAQKRKGRVSYYDPITFIKDGKVNKVEIPVDNWYTIVPYTTYSKFEQSLIKETSHTNGIVLSKNYCESLNIDIDDLENTKLNLEISVPIQQIDNAGEIEVSVLMNEDGKEVESKKIESRSIQYKTISMSFDIRGIQVPSTGVYEPYEYPFAFLKQETMQEIFLKYNQNFKPNAHMAKLNQVERLDEIRKEVESISPTLELYSHYDGTPVSKDVQNLIDLMLIIAIIPFALFMFVTLYILILQKKNRLYDYTKLMQYGYSLKSCEQWIMKKTIIEMMIFLILYFIFFTCLKVYLHYIYYPDIHFTICYFIFIIVWLLIIPIGVDIHALHKEFRN